MKTTTSYTCHKCHVQFNSRTDANKHYSDKWHQYNLMRCMKNLSVIPQEQYETLMKKSTFLQDAKNRINVISCAACKKNFTSQGSFETHQRSQKHKQNVVRKAAENVRRVQIQKEKMAIIKAKEAGEVEVVPETTETEKSQESQYCTACKAAFASQKDLDNHSRTDKHMIALKAAKLALERKQELDKQDEVNATTKDDDADANMEVEEVDSDEWDEEDEAAMEESKDDGKALPLSVCLFCGKRSSNLADNLGHMERQHSFIIPHQAAGDMEKLQNYLGEKIGAGHQCLECSKEFSCLRACRLHMLDKPHLAIRFEGEYDQFFDITKIMAEIQLPYKPAENEIFAFPLPNGTFLTHRDLKRYFNQKTSEPTAARMKRLTSNTIKAITHHGKTSAQLKTVQEVRKEQKRISANIQTMHKKQDYKKLDISVKANKLMKHFRIQVQNAG